MFVISKSDSYLWPITVKYPVDGGEFKKDTFKGQFKRLPQSRIKEIGEQIKAEALTDLDLAKEVLIGWKDVVDDSAQDIPFSESLRDRMLENQGAAAAVVIAFFESISGGKSKN